MVVKAFAYVERFKGETDPLYVLHFSFPDACRGCQDLKTSNPSHFYGCLDELSSQGVDVRTDVLPFSVPSLHLSYNGVSSIASDHVQRHPLRDFEQMSLQYVKR